MSNETKHTAMGEVFTPLDFEKVQAACRALCELDKRHADVLAERDQLKAINAELLEACKELLAYCGDSTPDSTQDMVRAAIAKASGKA